MKKSMHIKSTYQVAKIPLDVKGKPSLDAKKINEVYESVRPIRNTIIESALLVEHALTSVILFFIDGKSLDRRSILKNLLFDSDNFTFMQKRKVFSQIFEMKGDKITCLTPNEAKALRREINDIILERNKYAHGVIIIDCMSWKAQIKYFHGRERTEDVTPEIGKQFFDRCQECVRLLDKLVDYFRENEIIKNS